MEHQRMRDMLMAATDEYTPTAAPLEAIRRQSQRRSRRFRAVCALGALAIATGLAGVLWSTTRPGVDPAGGGTADPVVALETVWDAYPYGLFEDATLVLQDGCMLLNGRSVAFWPNGTTWDAESQSVVLPDGDRVVVGERVTLGGGAYPATTDYVGWLGAEVGHRLQRCIEATDAEGSAVLYRAK